MELFVLLVSLVHFWSISLGVGASTLAVAEFFVAIADGVIDDTERRMMGVVYIVLRIAMALILVTTVLRLSFYYEDTTLLSYSSIEQLVVLVVLFVNAILMTAHLVPTTIGPALQAGSWYALGVLAVLEMNAVAGVTFAQFGLGYLAEVVFLIAVFNAIMATLHERRLRREAMRRG